MSKVDSVMWDFYQTDMRRHLMDGHSRQFFLKKVVEQKCRLNNSKILEIGFGDGFLLHVLSKKRNNLFGVDISEKNVNIAKKKYPKVNFNLINTSGEFPFEDNYFDCVIASEVVEHMADEELMFFEKELKRILKKGGYFIGTVPADENLELNMCFCPNCKIQFHKWGHKQSWDKKKINRVFKSFSSITVSKKIFRGNNLNFWGILGFYLRAVINEFYNKLGGGNYVIILRK